MIKLTVLTLVLAIGTFPLCAIAQTAKIYSISGKGEVQVQREISTEWIPVKQGTNLYQGDQIFPNTGVQVYVRCPDWRQTVLVRAGVPSGMGSVCLNWANRELRGSQAEGTIGGINPTIPYLITPRHSLVLSHTPLIRWHEVSGVTEYLVEVKGPQGSMWRIKTNQTQLVYAGKPLDAGVPYSIIIHTNTGKFSEADHDNTQQQAPNLDFRILRPSEANMVKSTTANITANNEVDALTLADSYSNYVLPRSTIAAYKLPANTFETYSLTADAIAILESLLQQGKQSALIYRTLGDLYWQTGLVHLAQTNYLQAVDLVDGLEDMEDWTMAQYGLGQVFAATDDPQQAFEHLNQARIGYIFLGKKGTAKAIQRQIMNLAPTR